LKTPLTLVGPTSRRRLHLDARPTPADAGDAQKLGSGYVTVAAAAVKGEMGMAGSEEIEMAGPPGNYELRIGVPEDVGSDPDALRQYLMYLAEDMSEADRVVIKREHETGGGGDGGREWVDITMRVFGGGHCPGRVPGDGDEDGDGDGDGDGDVHGDPGRQFEPS
jgi:hypothetical protein